MGVALSAETETAIGIWQNNLEFGLLRRSSRSGHKKSQQQITVAGFKQNTPQWIPVEGENAKEKRGSGDPVVTPVVTELSERQFELLRLWSAMDETAKADLLAMARRCAAQSIENGPADR
ncbi:hypothetical protein [Rosistilla oblonga]|uniref:hypothetical protein n=1 Tax=Rosistilla oblonga TaxID=2527990 RepID=UPI003A979ABF